MAENSPAEQIVENSAPAEILQPASEPTVQSSEPAASPAVPEAPAEGQPTDPLLQAIRDRYPHKNYQSVDDYFKSQDSLERQFTVFRQAGLTPDDAMSALLAQRAPQPAPEPEFNAESWFGEFADNPKDAIGKLVQPISQSIEDRVMERLNYTLAARDAWGRVVAKHPDAESYDDQLREMSPAIAQMMHSGVPLEQAIERAYLIVKGNAPNTQAEVADRKSTRL